MNWENYFSRIRRDWIRAPEDGETALSDDEIIVAVREAFLAINPKEES
jgi:hypothetical protein